MTSLSSRQGLTLLELVVSLTICGAVVSAGFAGFQVMVDRRASADAMMEDLARCAALREQIRQWIEAARLPEQGGPAFAGLDAVHGNTSDDALTLLTGARTDLDVVPTVVHLSVDRDDETPEQGLVARLAGWPGSAAREIELDRRVTGLELRYFSIPLGDRGWLPSWVSSTLLPSGIEVRLSGDSLPPLLRLPLLVAVGSGR